MRSLEKWTAVSKTRTAGPFPAAQGKRDGTGHRRPPSRMAVKPAQARQTAITAEQNFEGRMKVEDFLCPPPSVVGELLPSICIVAHNAYGVLAGVDTGHIGGIEVQTPLMARWLAAQGYPVSMITWDESEICGDFKEGQVIDGITVHKLCKREAGLPVVRFLYPRWSSLNAALGRADPDIIYYNCGDLGLGQVVRWAHGRGRKVLYSVANDKDCFRSLPGLKPFRERLLYRYGLAKTDAVVVQTKKQQDLLLQEFGRKARVIPMPSKGIRALSYDRASSRRRGEPLRVLWIGRFAEQKRLEWLLDLAVRCPEVHFDVLGGANAVTPYSSMLETRAATVPNVILHGRVNHDGMARFYEQADVLCCTSTHEGFPNVFLEAWSLGMPIVTTFDPDNVVRTHGLGVVAANIEELKEGLSSLVEADAWGKASRAAKHYFSRFHEIDSSMALFADEFKQLISAVRVP